MSSAADELTQERESIFLEWLMGQGWTHARLIGDGRYVAIGHMAFTKSIVVGKCFDFVGYDDRWCFHDLASALRALEAWASNNYIGEPEGWHRHPMTGRRRDLSSGKEWITP